MKLEISDEKKSIDNLNFAQLKESLNVNPFDDQTFYSIYGNGYIEKIIKGRYLVATGKCEKNSTKSALEFGKKIKFELSDSNSIEQGFKEIQESSDNYKIMSRKCIAEPSHHGIAALMNDTLNR